MARALIEAFYLEDFLHWKKSFQLLVPPRADKPDPLADEAGVKYTPGFVHQVIYDTHLKDHEEPEEIEYHMCGPDHGNAAQRMLTARRTSRNDHV